MVNLCAQKNLSINHTIPQLPASIIAMIGLYNPLVPRERYFCVWIVKPTVIDSLRKYLRDCVINGNIQFHSRFPIMKKWENGKISHEIVFVPAFTKSLNKFGTKVYTCSLVWAQYIHVVFIHFCIVPWSFWIIFSNVIT